jgi:hypothetical protein
MVYLLGGEDAGGGLPSPPLLRLARHDLLQCLIHPVLMAPPPLRPLRRHGQASHKTVDNGQDGTRPLGWVSGGTPDR